MGLLEFLIVVLVIAWLLGAVVFPVGQIIHVLLVVILVVIVIRLLRGQQVL